MARDKARRAAYDGKRLGEKVRRIRISRGLTLKEIEAAVGVSATHVSEIERGKTSPTVGALGKIARALKVDLPTLLETGNGALCHVSRPADRSTVIMAGGAIELSPLSNPEPSAELSFFTVTLAPGATAEPRALRRLGEEVIVALEGRVEVETGSRNVIVATGDCLHVRSEGPLTFRNADPEPARFIWVSYPRLAL